MRKRISAILLAVAMVVTSFMAPLSVEAAQEAVTDYKVITPADYDAADADRKYPVVYVMPEDGYKMDNSGIVAKLQDAMKNGVSTDMIIVTPEFAEDTDLHAAMKALVDEVDAQYNTLTGADNRAVVGTGVGGYLAYILGLTEKGEKVQTLAAPELFKYVAGIRADFVSEENPWYSVYGDVYEYYTSMSAEALGNFFTYLDTPVNDTWADMKNSTHDLGQKFIGSGMDAKACEFTTRAGSFTEGFLKESVNRFSRRITDGVLGGVVTGTVSLKNTVLPSAASTFAVDYTVDTTEAINAFSAAETMEIIVKVLDPSTKEVLASNKTTAEVGATAAGTLDLEKNVKGTSATVVLSVKVLGAEFELATATALNVRETVVDGDYQLIDLMGDWNFHYLRRSSGLAGFDAVKADVESGAYKEWSVVQPGLDWWKLGFGDLVSEYGTGAWADYGYIGEAWYVKEFDVPSNFDAQELYLSVGNLDDRGQAFINGELVGETGMVDGEPNGESAWEEYSYYKIDASVLNVGGKNTIAVPCYNDGQGGGGWYAGPVALYSKSAFEADESTASFFTEYEFDSAYAASALGVEEETVKNKYLVALPESYDENPDKYYPTVYLMHQYNSTHKSYITDSIDKLLRNAAKKGLLDEMIIVVPNSQEESWWRGDWMKMVSEELVPLIDSTYRTIDDARYRFTAGCSMGGQGAYGVALQNPDLFSGAVSFFGAFSFGGDASPNTIVEKESKEYLDNFAMYFICGNQDIYKFGDPAVELHQQLLAKGVDHEFFIENGGHDSPFYVPHFVDAMVYARNNMYKSDDAVAEYLASSAVLEDGTLNVTVEALEGIEEYFNNIPASSYTKEETPALSVPVTIEVVQNGEVVFTATERANAVSADQMSNTYEYELPEGFDADAEFEVNVTASVFDRAFDLDTEVEIAQDDEPSVDDEDVNTDEDDEDYVDEEEEDYVDEDEDVDAGEDKEEDKETVKTGDEAPLMFYGLVAVMAAAIVAFILKRRMA